MGKPKSLFIIVCALGILVGAPLASWAQPAYGLDEEREVASSREQDIPGVKVHGPDRLTELVRQAIQEEWPQVAVETYYKPLRNRVWIAGTTDTGTMPLSPQRVEHMEAARAKGGSVYSALCSQQKEVLRKTVGGEDDWVRIDRRATRVERGSCYVRRVCPPPPPAIVCIPTVGVGFVIGGGPYPLDGYRIYGMRAGRGHHVYRRGRSLAPPHLRHGSHHPPGPSHRRRE